MYPEVEKFLAAVKAAEEACYKTPVQYGRHDASTCPACIKEAALKAALEPLEGSKDPLVSWIAKNAKSHAEEASMVLALLPASMAELDALALREDWCGTWEWFKDKARAAGVLPAETGAEVSA